MSKAYKNGAPSHTDLLEWGWGVKIHHSTRVPGIPTFTTVHLLPPTGDKWYVGETAQCHPDDNWDRKKGIAIALGRAWKLFNKHHPSISVSQLDARLNGNSPE